MYPWESKELIELKAIRENVSKMWNHTELELTRVNKAFILDELKQLSELINETVVGIDTEMDRLVKRDCAVFKNYTCSHCEGDKIYICDPCMDKQFEDMEKIDAPK